MEQRLIDANALMEATKNFCDEYKVHWTDNKVLAWIDHAPTVDAVPVVRCGECARRYTELCALYAGQMNGKDYFIQQDDDFCSYGERRADE